MPLYNPIAPNPPQYTTAQSSMFSLSGGTSGSYAQMTGNSVTLGAGTWTVSGYFLLYGGSGGVQTGYATNSGFYAANGNNTSTPPTAITASTFGFTKFPNDGTPGDFSLGNTAGSIYNSSTISFDIILTASTTLYLVPLVLFVVASDSEITAFISARKVL